MTTPLERKSQHLPGQEAPAPPTTAPVEENFSRLFAFPLPPELPIFECLPVYYKGYYK